MIAAAVVELGLPPESFGVPSTPQLGAEILEVLYERYKAQRNQALLAKLRSR